MKKGKSLLLNLNHLVLLPKIRVPSLIQKKKRLLRGLRDKSINTKHLLKALSCQCYKAADPASQGQRVQSTPPQNVLCCWGDSESNLHPKLSKNTTHVISQVKHHFRLLKLHLSFNDLCLALSLSERTKQ